MKMITNSVWFKTTCFIICLSTWTVVAQQDSQRNLTFPSPTPTASSSFNPGNITINNVTTPTHQTNGTTTTTTTTNGTIITTNTTTSTNGTNSTTTNSSLTSATTSSTTTSISISTTLAETKGVMGTDVPNPFYTGSTGGNSQNPDDSYVAGATKLVVMAVPWMLALSLGMIGGWVLI